MQPNYTSDLNQFKNPNNNHNGQKKRAQKVKPPKSINIPTKHTYQAVNPAIELPLDHPCQVYPRVSTPEQMKNISTEMQKDKSFAHSCGWEDHMIIVDDSDLGVSGQLRMEDRKAFNAMLRSIAKGEIKAVVVFNVDRLFRNRWGDESGKFMEICHTYGMLVVTPDFIYDFRISWHIDRFKRRCEEAWNYLEYHIYGRMIAAKFESARNGFWVGGGIPFGYIIDLSDFEAGVNPIIVSQFKRMKIDGGYTITTIYGLRHLLTNRAYIGYWLFKGEIINTKNHDAIIDQISFIYAYNRLSQTQFDGAENERLKTRRERYAKQHYADRPPILKEVIRSGDPNVRIYVKNGQNRGKIHTYYSFNYETEGKEWTHTRATVDAVGFDKIVLEKLREHLRSSEAEQDFRDFTKIEPKTIEKAVEDLKLTERDIEAAQANMVRIKAQVESGQLTDPDLAQTANASYEATKKDLKQLESRKKILEQVSLAGETSETLRDIERDIKATKANMARIKAQVESGQLTDPDLAQTANASYAAAKVELKRLEERKGATEQIAQEDNERRTYKTLMYEVDEAWNEVVLPEEHPRLVYLFIESVTLTKVSPSFCTAIIEWKGQMPSNICPADWEIIQANDISVEEYKQFEGAKLIIQSRLRCCRQRFAENQHQIE